MGASAPIDEGALRRRRPRRAPGRPIHHNLSDKEKEEKAEKSQKWPQVAASFGAPAARPPLLSPLKNVTIMVS